MEMNHANLVVNGVEFRENNAIDQARIGRLAQIAQRAIELHRLIHAVISDKGLADKQNLWKARRNTFIADRIESMREGRARSDANQIWLVEMNKFGQCFHQRVIVLPNRRSAHKPPVPQQFPNLHASSSVDQHNIMSALLGTGDSFHRNRRRVFVIAALEQRNIQGARVRLQLLHGARAESVARNNRRLIR